VAGVEQYGVEPVPRAARTVGWPDLFAINFTFFLNPVMYVLGALAVLEGGLSLPWALAATLVGQALAYVALAIVAEPGVEHGLPGQVAMRATFGLAGARFLTSPYRVIASTYWFAAQSLAAGLGLQAIVVAMGADRPPLVPTALAFAVFHAALAVLGFDVMRWLLRVVLPLSLASAATLIALYLASDDPRYGLGRVLDSPDQRSSWEGFAVFVTVMCGSSLTLVTNVADLCRYTRSRRDMRIGLVSSALLATLLTTFIGGYVAAASRESNPFVAATELTSSKAVLSLLVAAIVVQTIAANLTNVYTSGLSLVNTAPSLGRVRATVLAGLGAIVLSGFPSLIEEAQVWITRLGNLAAPITGVVLVDYLVVQRSRLDVEALYALAGRYRFSAGLNLAALVAVAAGTAVYTLVPGELVKVVWGAGTGAAVYLALRLSAPARRAVDAAGS